MNRVAISIEGVTLFSLPRFFDERGVFDRVYCNQSLARAGINFVPVQSSVCMNPYRLTLRGIHYQRPPGQEAKLVRCLSGAVYDVVVDMRPDSPTYLDWMSFELSSVANEILYVPEGCGHGYLTTTENTVLLYQISRDFNKNYARGVRYNDPSLSIPWPAEPRLVSQRDLSFPDILP